MKWCESFHSDRMPTMQEVNDNIDSPLYSELCGFIEHTYSVTPKLEYSRCSAAPGWNLKYRKAGKSICTIYPHEGFFTCLVVAGEKNATEVELILETCEPSIQKLYQTTTPMSGSRWLMIDVTNAKTLEDVKKLILIRVKAKKTA